MANIKKKVLVSIEAVNWELQVETGKNHGKVDSLSQWLHTVLNGCGPKCFMVTILADFYNP